MHNQTAFRAALGQRFQKRRRVNSHPRAESSSPATFSSTSANFSSTSASFSSTSATTSSRSSGSSSISRSQSSSSASRSVSSASDFSSHATSLTISSQSRASSKTSSLSRSSSQSTSSVASQTTSLVSRTSSSASLSTFRSASTSVFLSTVIVTVSGSTTTVVATSSGTIGTSSGSSSGTSFAHNVGAIVGIAIGSGVAVLLGAALLFFTCKRFRRQRTPAAEVELARRPPVDVPSTDTGPQPVPEEAPGASGYHYTRARPRMPPTPPSSSSMAGLIGRLRGGRASTSSSVPVLESTTPLAQPSPVAPIPHYLSSSHSLAPPRIPGTPPPGSPRLPGTPPGSPRLRTLPQHTASPRPSSLLNPRVNDDMPSAPPSPAPGLLGWRPPGPEQPSPSPAPEAPVQEQEPPRSPVGLLRPSLAVLQFESSRTLGDHEDYSRPIGARVNMRMESDITAPSGEEDE